MQIIQRVRELIRTCSITYIIDLSMKHHFAETDLVSGMCTDICFIQLHIGISYDTASSFTGNYSLRLLLQLDVQTTFFVFFYLYFKVILLSKSHVILEARDILFVFLVISFTVLILDISFHTHFYKRHYCKLHNGCVPFNIFNSSFVLNIV